VKRARFLPLFLLFFVVLLATSCFFVCLATFKIKNFFFRLSHFATQKKKKKKIRSFSSFPRKTLKSFLPSPPSRGIPHKTKQRRRQNSPALSQLPTPSLSLSSFAHLRGKENGFKARDAS